MKKILLPGIIASIIISILGMVLGMVFNMIFPSLAAEYANTIIFRPWTDPIMQLFWIYPFVTAIGLAWIWDKAKPILSESTTKAIMQFAVAYFIISQLPGMIITYSSFQISLLIVSTWVLNGFINGFIVAYFCSIFNKR